MDISALRTALHGRFDDVSAAVFVAVQPHGAIVCVNSEAEELTGYELAELEKMTLSEIFSDADKTRIRSLFNGPMDRFFKKLFEHNVIIQKRSKRKIIVDMGFKLTQIGDTQALVFTLQDITDLKNSEQRITRANQYVNNIIGSMIETLVVVDSEGQIKTVNATGLQLLEYTEQELTGKRLDLILKEVAGVAFEPKKLLRSGYAAEVEALFESKSGKQIPVLISASKLGGTPDQQQGGLVIVAMDITERKKAEQLIATQQMMIVQASKMSALGEMASGIAHEINNPLQVLKGQCEILDILLQRDLAINLKKVQDAIGLVDNMGGRIEKIVNGLRTFSRDQSLDEPEATEVNKIMTDTLALCGQRIRNSGTKLDITSVADTLSIECRPTEISQIILNLLNNAHDAVENQSDKWIKVDINDFGHCVTFVITNSGEPIKREIAKKIFQPFFTTKAVGKGTGLGLSISRSIAEAHSGSLTLDETASNPRFILTIPKVALRTQATSKAS